jgi:hypothetical protein
VIDFCRTMMKMFRLVSSGISNGRTGSDYLNVQWRVCVSRRAYVACHVGGYLSLSESMSSTTV